MTNAEAQPETSHYDAVVTGADNLAMQIGHDGKGGYYAGNVRNEAQVMTAGPEGPVISQQAEVNDRGEVTGRKITVHATDQEGTRVHVTLTDKGGAHVHMRDVEGKVEESDDPTVAHDLAKIALGQFGERIAAPASEAEQKKAA